MQQQLCFGPAHILLPDESIPLEQWACVACDQFTSDPGYWQRAEAVVGDVPSALRLILPEVYLGSDEAARRTALIAGAMREYEAEVFTRAVDGYIYVERTTQSGRIRQGLVGVVDLEAYSYTPGEPTLVRPSESTVVERLPPRMAVRREATLELPHVMMLADDPDKRLIEPIGHRKPALRPLYEGELMLGGGGVAGWAVEDPAMIEQINAAVAFLQSQQHFDETYPDLAGGPPLALAVGDGNHSLATAKACWEALKPTLTEEERATHPARWCLAEVCNVRSEAIEIEPIHRAVFGAPTNSLLLGLLVWGDFNGVEVRVCPSGRGEQSFTVQGHWHSAPLRFEGSPYPLTVGTVEAFLESFCHEHPEARVDYIHGREALLDLCQHHGAVGIELPAFDKGDLFKGVVRGGVLPRKTFSMGHAEEKRYYIEARRIVSE